MHCNMWHLYKESAFSEIFSSWCSPLHRCLCSWHSGLNAILYSIYLSKHITRHAAKLEGAGSIQWGQNAKNT